VKVRGDVVFNNSGGQINIASDQSTIHAAYSTNRSRDDRMEKLMSALAQLHEALERESAPDKELVQLSAMTENLMKEVKSGEISGEKLRRFREALNQFTAEMQLGSTLLAAISAASDIIQTVTST
jgi:hypothetical protein